MRLAASGIERCQIWEKRRLELIALTSEYMVSPRVNSQWK